MSTKLPSTSAYPQEVNRWKVHVTGWTLCLALGGFAPIISPITHHLVRGFWMLGIAALLIVGFVVRAYRQDEGMDSPLFMGVGGLGSGLAICFGTFHPNRIPDIAVITLALVGIAFSIMFFVALRRLQIRKVQELHSSDEDHDFIRRLEAMSPDERQIELHRLTEELKAQNVQMQTYNRQAVIRISFGMVLMFSGLVLVIHSLISH